MAQYDNCHVAFFSFFILKKKKRIDSFHFFFFFCSGIRYSTWASKCAFCSLFKKKTKWYSQHINDCMISFEITAQLIKKKNQKKKKTKR
jgi:hypothetical protein